MKVLQKKLLNLAFLYVLIPLSVLSQEVKTIPLPQPQKTGGRPLMEVINERKSTREFADKELSDQILSNLLWAAFGINRPESGKRTAPSARNRQEIDIYVATSKGVFLYDAKLNSLILISEEDTRAKTGTQPYVKDAPLNLVYVADLSKMGDADENQKFADASASTGFIGQNVYLFCASENLATVIRGSIDRESLGKSLKLKYGQKIILSQTVGYPKE